MANQEETTPIVAEVDDRADLRSSIEASVEKLSEPAPLRGEGPEAAEVKTDAAPSTEFKSPEAKTDTPSTEVKTEVQPTPEVTEEKRWADRLEKAPPTWKAETRETWAQIPPAARLEIHRRESEVYKALQTTKDAREFHREFGSMAAPYQALLAQEGGPLNGFREYLSTASMLRIGTPHEKANAVAGAIMKFGVPLELLDSALAGLVSGNPAAQPQSQSGQPQQFRDPRFDQFMQEVQARESAQKQQIQVEVATELQQFEADPKNEFFNDVRETMGDILEVAARRGKHVSLMEAYNQAVQFHPDISKISAARQKQATAAELTAAAQKARGASVQVSGGPVVPGGMTASDGTVRGAIENAIATLGSR